MLISYKINEHGPLSLTEISDREKIRSLVQSIADEYGLEMEPFTAWEEDNPERVQGVFLNTSTPCGPWCIGAIVRRRNGELRVWPRDEGLLGPIQGSSVIEVGQLDTVVLDMVEQYTAT